jgi:hypothetical protein
LGYPQAFILNNARYYDEIFTSINCVNETTIHKISFLSARGAPEELAKAIQFLLDNQDLRNVSGKKGKEAGC